MSYNLGFLKIHRIAVTHFDFVPPMAKNQNIMKKFNKYLCLIIVFAWLLAACDEEFETPPDVTTSEDFVDLRPQQSALKDQGGRTTCIVFAGVAAVEAAYKRIGYGEVDLSEEFINFARKSFYLHPIWTDIVDRGEDARETQLGHTGGGGGVGVVAELAKGFKIPLEPVMPYQSSNNYYQDNYQTLRDINIKSDAGEELLQRDYSNFNLDPGILTDTQLRAEKYYSVAQYREIDDARDPAKIEAILKRGNEVVWDFAGAVPWETGGRDESGIWQACNSCSLMGHSMLIVGYDKRDDDPDNHYFIVKNSWGNSWAATGGEGYTYISYDYLRNYGVAASYIVLANPPSEWPEIAFIGRWKFNYDGFKGDLDIYHIPGMAQYTFEYNYGVGAIPEVYDDYRIGTYYDTDGNAYKVNGSIEGNRIEFYFDIATPLQKWDEKLGRKFVYYLDQNNFMAGQHTDGDGKTYGGYARKAGLISGGSQTPRPFESKSYVDSSWDFYTEKATGTIEFTEDVSNQEDDFYLLNGTFASSDGTTTSAAQIKIPKAETNRAYIQIADIGNGEGSESFIGKHLSWEGGLITGNTPETGFSLPFYMIRQ